MLLVALLCGSVVCAQEISIEALSTSNPSPWWVGVQRAGYFGRWGLGTIYKFSDQHEVAASLGVSNEGNTAYGQMNAAYRYAPWLYEAQHQHLWKPLQMGLFAIYSMNDGNYFFNSPPKYPGAGYYDGTDFRFGLELGSSYLFESTGIEIGYRMRVIDLGFPAIYNNAHRDLQYYISSGFELNYHLVF